MSTGPRTPREEAIAQARAMIDLCEGSFARWVVAGSLRRGRPDVGDVEHVVMPTLDEIPAREGNPDLFGRPTTVTPARTINLLLQRLDGLIHDRKLTQAVKSDGRTRWGDRYRAVCLPGSELHHELWICDRMNFGAMLAIRTGPQEIGIRLASRLRERGMRQDDGYLHRVGRELAPDGTVREVLGPPIPVETEERYFELAGWKPMPPPQQRDDLADHFRRGT